MLCRPPTWAGIPDRNYTWDSYILCARGRGGGPGLGGPEAFKSALTKHDTSASDVLEASGAKFMCYRQNGRGGWGHVEDWHGIPYSNCTTCLFRLHVGHTSHPWS